MSIICSRNAYVSLICVGLMTVKLSGAAAYAESGQVRD